MLSARYDLPGIKEAAILRCLGYACEVSVESDRRSAGKTVKTWYCQSAVSEAVMLVNRQFHNVPGMAKKGVLYDVCRDAIDNLSALKIWFSGCNDWYRIIGEPTPTSLLGESAQFISVPQSWIEFIACAIACGHRVKPHPVSGNAELSVSSSGSNLKELHIAEVEIRKRHKDPKHIAQAVTIGRFEPDEHPFMYAREAIAHVAACKLDESVAEANPIWLMAGHGGRSAAVSASLASEGKTADLLKKHLTGML